MNTRSTSRIGDVSRSTSREWGRVTLMLLILLAFVGIGVLMLWRPVRAQTQLTDAAPVAESREDESLTAWWKLDEGAGTTLLDGSGKSHAAALAGDSMPVWVLNDAGGVALAFDGRGGFAYSADDVLPIPPGDQVSISAWVLPGGKGNGTIVDTWAGKDTGGSYGLFLNDGTAVFQLLIDGLSVPPPHNAHRCFCLPLLRRITSTSSIKFRGGQLNRSTSRNTARKIFRVAHDENSPRGASRCLSLPPHSSSHISSCVL